MHVLEFEILFMAGGSAVGAFVLPNPYVRELLVVALALAVHLVLFAEVTAAAFVALESITAHELAEQYPITTVIHNAGAVRQQSLERELHSYLHLV